jgi:predicted nucleic acid-binding protein
VSKFESRWQRHAYQKTKSSRILSLGGRTGVRLVADANVLLSAVIGGRAKAVLEHPSVEEVLTSEATLAEVQEYATQLAAKKRLSQDVVLLAVASLPVRLVEREAYEKSIPEAKRRIGRRDPDDIEILALAIHTGAPIWSNDNDFEDVGVEWFTTAELLARLK